MGLGNVVIVFPEVTVDGTHPEKSTSGKVSPWIISRV